MSLETSASSLYSRMSRILPWAASRTAALTSSRLAFLSSLQTRSTIEPSGTGTRMAQPSSLPLSCGSTLPTARAAPVVVGMMFSAAARERRKSLCGTSARRWSLV